MLTHRIGTSTNKYIFPVTLLRLLIAANAFHCFHFSNNQSEHIVINAGSGSSLLDEIELLRIRVLGGVGGRP